MSQLLELLPDATPALQKMLAVASNVVPPPIRSEIFGLKRFAQHGRSLALTHRAAKANSGEANFFPRLRSNISMLREAHRYIAIRVASGYDISPAAEWLLDNFHLIEAQLREIHEGLPRSYFQTLPVLLEEPLAGLPRIYGVAWAFVAHNDSAFDEDTLVHFLNAYQEACELRLSEMWALPTTLRVVLIENLRRLAEREAMQKAAREAANLCCDHIDDCSLSTFDGLLDVLNQRGVGRVFLAQMAQRLQERGSPEALMPREWLANVLPDLAGLLAQQSVDQAADNLSVSNAVTALRAIGAADWPDIVARSSALMQLMLTSPSFEAEHTLTQDETLHAIELLAARTELRELAVARTLLTQMSETDNSNGERRVASFWLEGAGRPELLRAMGFESAPSFDWRSTLRRLKLTIYLGSLLLGTLALVLWLLAHPDGSAISSDSSWVSRAWLGLVAVLMLFPASEIVVAVVNRLISESARPKHLPRLALVNGIPPEHRVMVVIPCMLTDSAAINRLADRLLLHYLANPEPQAQFALLTDWSDADSATLDSDVDLLSSARSRIDELNARYPTPGIEGQARPRFLILHRPREFSETEQRWIGWERKRGKLELLMKVLTGGLQHEFFDLGEASNIAPDTRYVVTLDADTQLPPGRLREMVAVAAHPYNQPIIDRQSRTLVGGYAILQPRLVTPLPARNEVTLFHWLFSGQCGIDPYSAASSEVYQDLFGEGTFTGKGLLNVHAVHTLLAGRLPEGRVLSHDLLEGSLARCAAISDLALIEEAPFHADVAASRVHRWTRGDWQLLPFMFNTARYPIAAVNRWKMLDNLRRSLVAPTSLLLLIGTLTMPVVSPWAAFGLVLAAFTAGPLMGALAGLLPGRRDLAKWHFFRNAAADLMRAVCAGLWHLSQLLQHALMATDAMARALYRMSLSRRHLLQWTTSEAAQASAKTALFAVLRQHWDLPLVALLLMVLLMASGTPFLALSIAICALWAASPLFIWWISRARATQTVAILPEPERAYLLGVARDSWRLFERCVGPQDNHLPPDNLQTMPRDMVAHRTSPTNIGLYLLSAACARQFGWIGTQDLITRIQATLATLKTLERYRGHFLNWYDTQSAAPLTPQYVSTVDSGNLSSHLLAVSAACQALALAPYDSRAARVAIQVSINRLSPLLAHLPQLLSTSPHEGALARLLALSDPLTECQQNTDEFEFLLRDAADELTSLVTDKNSLAATARSTPSDELLWCLEDHLATLRSAVRDCPARPIDEPSGLDASALPIGNVAAQSGAALQLRALAAECEALAWQANFSFLFHRKRNLFHIGYRVAEQQLDASFYDLLASESRVTSLLAIAKGDVPVRHWWSIARPFFAAGRQAGLRSWSGSMFEYLMPTLVLNEPFGSVLQAACKTAVREQIAFTEGQGLPWGISESAYADSDYTLAYQYGPQGVPRLALRRTPPDELVIAPYACALAAQILPLNAVANFRALEALSARARYGFIEALDFTPSRQTGAQQFTPVSTFMAHHQGMSIVALANALLDGLAQQWGMANPHLQAVSSLLHERAPREVSMLDALPSGPALLPTDRRAVGLLREITPGMTAVEPTHLLSNGHYHVSLRANGAGHSSLGQIAITRRRDDALRDSFGSFLYLRWDRKPWVVSVTQHPAPDATAQYQSVYHADRVCFEATWPQLQAYTTVWVSPEDDIEFRQVELRNSSEHAIDMELISAFEVTLSDPQADEAHPAFTNMFVHAEWHAAQQALIFERKPRLANEQVLRVAHFLADSDAQVLEVRVQTDRAEWLGRNQTASRPLAAFEPMQDGISANRSTRSSVLGTGLDPVCAMAVHLRIAPHAKVQLTFATAASANSGSLQAVIDKYCRQRNHVQRASMMSATLAGIRLRALRISTENFVAIQTLTTALLFSLGRGQSASPAALAAAQSDTPNLNVCDRRLLWRFSISGERPIILVSVSVAHGMGLLRSLVQALHLWSRAGIACDLVIVNAEPASYLMTLHREITTLRERYFADSTVQATAGGVALAGFHLLRGDEVSADELSTLKSLARVRLYADGRPLVQHVLEWRKRHEDALEHRQNSSSTALALTQRNSPPSQVSTGEFATRPGEFSFKVSADVRPLRPWINVLSNPVFGAQISESGGGYSWAINSRMNQLTAWSNDPVSDTPSEWFLLQDRKSMKVWSLAPGAWGQDDLHYQVSHGQGYSRIAHRRGALEVQAQWSVDSTTSVKQIRVQLTNHGSQALELRLVGIAEWIMGASRRDRATVHTSLHRQRLPATGIPSQGSAAERARKLTALLCTQLDRSGGFGHGTAFLALTASGDELEDWSCDRRECFDARGRLVLPDHFGERAGYGLDPCAALSCNLNLAVGATVERVFMLGFAGNPEAARQLATQAAMTPAVKRQEQVQQRWNELLGAVSVRTPDPLFDVMVNRWLLYQTVSCRLWSKAGFYQAGGATGFRDQLQDTMALSWAAPQYLRQQILTCASRQFVEGDVQHWWHMPAGAGVRTHFSDDLLWLPYACAHYVRATADLALLEETVAYLDGLPIAAGAEDIYFTPAVSSRVASVYEHAAATIDRSLAVGSHGLPLMGSGDWNDGMNRVGHQGRGESVWLAWFLIRVIADFAPLARARGDDDRVRRWQTAAQQWAQALHGPAWDGQWFKRAFFDDGQPLGSHSNVEGRIDLIAQAWSVLSGAAPLERQTKALACVEQMLVDKDAGLIRLLDPPLVNATPEAGYIQAYPPGVRENGGQYSHAAVWALMAQAELGGRVKQAKLGVSSVDGNDVADFVSSAEPGDLAYRYFTYLSPAHRTAHPTRGPVYAIEPYVMAGDIYSAPPYVGRGGWSWYTGAAAWLHRAAIESMFGLQLGARELCFKPCLPSDWPQAELTLSRDGRVMRFIIYRRVQVLSTQAPLDMSRPCVASLLKSGAQILVPGQSLEWTDLPPESCFLIPLP